MRQEIYDYLTKQLREGRRTNMMYSEKYLRRDFGLSRKDAQVAVLLWMKTLRK